MVRPANADLVAPLGAGAASARPSLRALLWAPTPGRFQFALRQALACVLTAWVAIGYGTPEPALAAYVIFFLNKPDRVSSVVFSLALTLVISVVIGIVLLLAMTVLDHAAWRVGSMAALSFGLLFLVSASKLRPIGGIVALVAAYALDKLGAVPAGEAATRGLLYAWLFVGLPAAISLIVNLLLAPSPRQLVQRALAEQLSAAAAVLRSPGGSALHALRLLLRESDHETQARLKLAGLEHSSPAEHLAALRQAADATLAVLLAAELMATTPAAAPPQAARDALADTLDRMAVILRRGGYPVDVVVAAPDAPLAPLAASAWAAMADALTHFAQVEPALAAAPPEKPAGGFFVADAFSNPVHLQYAFKTTAAAMICYLTYSLLDWPGIHTSLITCYIVSLGTLGESVEKLALRFVGCLVGAALGLAVMIFVIPSVTSLPSYLLIVFVGALASAWIALGSPRISYAGFQMAFAFFLCVIQGSAASFDMVVARDRCLGILFGISVVYLISTQLWPVSIAARIDRSLQAAVASLGRLLRSPGGATRRHIVAQQQAQIASVENDLDLARLEPGSIGPPAAWLHERRAAVEALAALVAPLWLLAERADPAGGPLAAHLDRLSGTAAPPVAAVAAAPTAGPSDAGAIAADGPTLGAGAPLQALAWARMRRLEQTWAPLQARGEPLHAPA